VADTNELVQERIERLLPSQREYLFAPEKQRVFCAGYGVGKTRILCLAGMLFSWAGRQNFGFIGRADGKALQTTTYQMLMDEIIPSSMVVGRPKSHGQFGKIITLRTRFPGVTSQIYLDYVVDKTTGRSHLAGGNWGWYAIDQIEEIQRAHWEKLLGRLRRTYYDPDSRTQRPFRYHALGVANQQGHDWIFEDFFQGGDYIFDLRAEPKRFFKTVRRDNRFGIVTRSDENRMSNGGFAPDDFFDELRISLSPQMQARILDGSFDDFSGKILPDFNLSSVHNVEPFVVPNHWGWYTGIDPGGSAPWGIPVIRVDEHGNKIMVSDAPEVYRELNLNPNKAIAWIKANVPVELSRFVIDYQNKGAMIQMQDEGIQCEPANKDVFPGLMKLQSEFYVNPKRALPDWYVRTQPKERVAALQAKGSPSVYVFNTCKYARKELDDYIWNPTKPNEPKGNQADHLIDPLRYVLVTNPQAAAPVFDDPFREMRQSDPTSAAHGDRVARELRRLRLRDYAHEEQMCEPCDGGIVSDRPVFISDFSGN